MAHLSIVANCRSVSLSAAWDFFRKTNDVFRKTNALATGGVAGKIQRYLGRRECPTSPSAIRSRTCPRTPSHTHGPPELFPQLALPLLGDALHHSRLLRRGRKASMRNARGEREGRGKRERERGGGRGGRGAKSMCQPLQKQWRQHTHTHTRSVLRTYACTHTHNRRISILALFFARMHAHIHDLSEGLENDI